MKHWLLIFGIAGIAGCAHYQAHPLAPAQIAAHLEARRLDDPGLKHFLEQAEGHPPAKWPLPEWDLNTLYLAAFYYHPSLEVARAQWAVAQAGIQTAAGRPNPSITITPGYDTTATIISHWLPMGTLDWPIETAGKRGKRMTEAQDQAASARWDIITAAWQVRSNVRNTLLDWRAAERRSELLERQISLQEQIVKRMQQRAEAGDIARPDMVAAQINLSRNRLDLLDAQSKSSDARARLAGAMGLSTSALEGIKINGDFPTNSTDALTAPEARRIALQSRSEILGALADYAVAEDDLRLEVAKQYPDVHFGPGYQYNQGDNQWLLGVTVELPLLNQNQGPIAAALARRELAAAKFKALQAQVIGEIDQAVAGYRLAMKQVESGKALLNAEQEQEKSAHDQQAAGAADQFDLLAAQLELAGTRLVQLDSAIQVQRARGALEDALQHPLDEITSAALQQVTAVPAANESHP